jgi:hypothetical protein
MAGDDFVNRTTEVQINEVGLYPVDHCSCGFRHLFWVGAKQLDPNWPFFRPKSDHLPSPLVSMKNAIGRNKFGNDHISTLFFAQPAKNRIRDSGHWGQVERDFCRTKPRKHGSRVGLSLRMGNRINGAFTIIEDQKKLIQLRNLKDHRNITPEPCQGQFATVALDSLHCIDENRQAGTIDIGYFG